MIFCHFGMYVSHSNEISYWNEQNNVCCNLQHCKTASWEWPLFRISFYILSLCRLDSYEDPWLNYCISLMDPMNISSNLNSVWNMNRASDEESMCHMSEADGLASIIMTHRLITTLSTHKLLTHTPKSCTYHKRVCIAHDWGDWEMFVNSKTIHESES